ncbi:MAG: hypothetical protein HOI85_03140, partial [Euryarchaeota archaeon]|nr:hypothetical protein [Euryarchaeota archaeon]
PLFILVWAGSILTVLATLILGTMNLTGTQLYLLWVASALYLFGVQLPTFRFNIPLNDSLQALDIEALMIPRLQHPVRTLSRHGIVGTDSEP